jgi:hypothetical protein
VATAVWHCPVYHILWSLKCLPLQIKDGYNRMLQLYLMASKYASFLRFVLRLSSVFFTSQTARHTLSWGYTYFLQIQVPHQCPRFQKGEMKHVPYWRCTHIKHYHQKFSCPNDPVPGICLPLPTVQIRATHLCSVGILFAGFNQHEVLITSKLIFSIDHAVWKEITILSMGNVHSV